ncbi:MAG: flagellar hook-length control protein FliK [Candidatus Oleimicrobiaceae bacterium]
MQAIARELAQSLRLMVRAEETRLRVTIAQSELGRIAVDLTKHDQTVSAQFRVESPQAQALLESSFSELRTVLGEQGLQLGELSVAVEQRGEGRQGWHKPEESASYAPDAAHPEPAGPREAPREPPRVRLFGYNTIEITA